MHIRVLGAAAGGGFPQWNCNAPTSRAAWSGNERAASRTQSSMAVSSDGESWVILNASPDIRQQIAATPALQPRTNAALRNSPLQAVVLTNADVDHIAGLLSLRERQPLTLYGTTRVLDVLASNSIFNVLHPGDVTRRALKIGEPQALKHRGTALGLTVEPFSVPGKIALFLEDPSQGEALGTREGDTVGLKVSEPASGRSFYYVPGCAAVDAALRRRLHAAALVFFDGTLFTDDEMVAQGLSDKTGRRMGHISMSGPDGSMAAFADLAVARRVYVHINTSNPVLLEGSSEREAVMSAGWEIAHDGMEIVL